MIKKFEKEAMVEGNNKWEQAISRMEKLYDPIYGDAPMRSEFDRDYTRVINCNAYRRLKHKTQVFFAPKNDHICTRIEHVNLVESISNTIANYLGLNSELTKAIAVTHDIGHSPFGHQGERILSTISQREYGEKFGHGRNGVHYVDDLELLRDIAGIKRNLNLTYAVRDGIIGHCGNPKISGQKPRDEFIDMKKFNEPNKYDPFTWEGCVVKLADNISYLGRDLEDAKEMKLLTEKDLKTIDEYFDFMKIDVNDRDKLLKDYSHGMKNKMQMLVNIIASPKILLFDEPLTSFDVVVSEEMKEMLRSIKNNHIIIFSTHIMELALDLCDEIVILNKGILTEIKKDNLDNNNFKNKIIEALKE